ncbi:hypothetical protein AB5N19_08732 [Seiridium cardinale]
MGAQAETALPAAPGKSTLSSASNKRKLPSSYTSSGVPTSSGSSSLPWSGQGPQENSSYEQTSEEKPKKPRKQKGDNKEKRIRRFRPKAPLAFNDVYQRAISQRFYILDRIRSGTAQCPEETVELTGSTGNIYSVHIAHQSTCTCPHANAGNQCKHVIYVLSRVLRAKYDLVYQLALLSSELVEIFNNAPPIEVGGDAQTANKDKNRKELEGDCPICFMPFEGADATVYCRAQCGQNIHKQCFEMWAATKRQERNAQDSVTCPMCRTPWQGDEDMVKKIRNTGEVGSEGYVNVANQLGISTIRDESTYHTVPRRGQSYHGYGAVYGNFVRPRRPRGSYRYQEPDDDEW